MPFEGFVCKTLIGRQEEEFLKLTRLTLNLFLKLEVRVRESGELPSFSFIFALINLDNC